MSGARASIAALAALTLLGCATRNARLDLAIELPTSSEFEYVELVARADPTSFDEPAWDGAPAERLTELGDTARVQILAEQAIEAPLGLRLRFCRAEPCAIVSPELRVRFERAFYVAEVTSYTLEVSEVPTGVTGPLPVGACAVAGCLEEGDADYCRLDGSHYCEAPAR